MSTRDTLSSVTTPAQVSAPTVELEAGLHHPCVGAIDNTQTHLVVTLKASEEGPALRPKLGIIPVVDRSGSMSTEHKLAVVTSALTHLSSYLDDEDYIGLITFDDEIDTLVAPTTMALGADAFTSALAQLRPRGSTNLHGGIKAGIKAARAIAARGEGHSVRVVVLTDGLANVGETHPRAMEALVADLPDSVSVSFLGVGTDCDHNLLGRLADAGGGSYGFIEAAASAADVLGAEIGGLLSTALADASVTVTGRKYARIGAPLGSIATVVEGGYRVRLGNLLCGQTRHLVFPVETIAPGRGFARAVTIADVALSGLCDDQQVVMEALPKVLFGTLGERDEGLDEAIDLARVRKAQEAAEMDALLGRYQEARAHLFELDLVCANAQQLRDAIAANYEDVQTYTSTASMRNSSRALLNNRLAGSSEAFDALAARTVGSYTTADQRSTANETRRAVDKDLKSPASR